MKKITSLKWKIGRYLLIFGLLVIGMIFLFQIMLLKPMYENNRVAAVKETMDYVTRALDEGNLEEVIYSSQDQNNTCIRVWKQDEDSRNMISVSSNNMGCFLYRMKPEESMEMIANAVASEDGTYLSTKSTSPAMQDDSDSEMREITYTKVIEENGCLKAIMVYTGISPVDSTIATLKEQLWIITAFIALSVILLTFALNAQIAKPLAVINDKAKTLPEGRYEEDPKTNRYSEAKELNETLTKAADDIQKADKAKRDLIANVSHDLRTPLTMIGGYGEMMIDLPDEKTDENIQVIIDEAKRLNTLVNDLLDLSKLQENKIVLQCEVFDITSLIRAQMKKYEVYEYRDGYQIETFLDDDAYINADYARIEQVFNNFMTNAINYSGSSRHVIVSVKKHDGIVRTEVRDFGEGIEEAQISQIWDRYYKIDKTHVRSSSGSGIGLSIVREILELHHARYGVNSVKNEGSTFWFEFKEEASA